MGNQRNVLTNARAAFSLYPECSMNENMQRWDPVSSSWLPEADKPFMCTSCGKGYTHIFTLNRHRRTVCGKIKSSGGSWKCPRCSRTYVNEGNLARHVKFECGVRRKFRCIFCNHKFTQRCSLLRHLKTFHSENPEAADAVMPHGPPEDNL